MSSSPPNNRPEFMVTLGLLPPYSAEDIKAAYFEKARAAHPDRGGTAQDFVRLQDAYQKAVEYAGLRASRMHWLGAWTERYATQQSLVEAIEQLGGRVIVEPAGSITASIGEDFAHILDQVSGVELKGRKIDANAIDFLLSQRPLLINLRTLDLSGSRVSDVAVARLAVLEKLQRIDLSDTPVTYSGIEPLVRLPYLEELKLDGTQVGWWRKLLVGRKLGARRRRLNRAL